MRRHGLSFYNFLALGVVPTLSKNWSVFRRERKTLGWVSRSYNGRKLVCGVVEYLRVVGVEGRKREKEHMRIFKKVSSCVGSCSSEKVGCSFFSFRTWTHFTDSYTTFIPTENKGSFFLCVYSTPVSLSFCFHKALSLWYLIFVLSDTHKHIHQGEKRSESHSRFLYTVAQARLFFFQGHSHSTEALRVSRCTRGQGGSRLSFLIEYHFSLRAALPFSFSFHFLPFYRIADRRMT
jgi:hypothetical protein